MTNPAELLLRARRYSTNLLPLEESNNYSQVDEHSGLINSANAATLGGYDVWGTYHDAPSSENIIRVAKVTHAQGYLHEGLATEAAVTRAGFLRAEVDKWTKTPAQIYVAKNPDDALDTATLRIGIGELEMLPTMPLMLGAGALHPEAVEKLRSLPEGSVSELGAFAKSRIAHEQKRSRGVATIIRSVFQDTLGQGRTLYCSMVAESHEKYAEVLGPDNLTPIGSPVLLEANEFRKATVLVPLTMSPEAFAPNLLNGIKSASDMRVRNRLVGSLVFFTEGMEASDLLPHMPEQAVAEICMVRQMAAAYLATKQSASKEPVPA